MMHLTICPYFFGSCFWFRHLKNSSFQPPTFSRQTEKHGPRLSEAPAFELHALRLVEDGEGYSGASLGDPLPAGGGRIQKPPKEQFPMVGKNLVFLLFDYSKAYPPPKKN